MRRRVLKGLNLIGFYMYNRIGALVMPLEVDAVAFLSESHLSLDGNLKAVHDALGDGYKKRVLVKPDRRDQDGIVQTLKVWRALTISKYVFLDDFYGLTSVMRVRPGQELVQLWHGSGAFKKFGFSRVNTGDNIKHVNSGYRKYTKVAVTSELARECFAEAFDVPMERVQAVGSPRTDIFFDEKRKSVVRGKLENEFPEITGKKVVLVAPTYRGRKVEDASYDFERLNLKALAEGLGSEYCILTKWHPALYNNIVRGVCGFDAESIKNLKEGAARIIDASGYGDINDLLLITDVLVTDYSSVIFDYYLLDRPIVYFTYDKDEYSGSRGLYFGFDTYVYGEIATCCEELATAIKKENLCEEKRAEFNERYMKACTGHSTENVIEWVFDGARGSDTLEG